MRRLLALLAILLLAGCGSISGQVSGAVSLDTPTGPVTVSFELPQHGLRGALPVLLALCDYADTPCPYTEQQAAALGQRLDGWIIRQSTGAAWAAVRVARVTLSGTAEDYAAPIPSDNGSTTPPSVARPWRSPTSP